MKRALIGVLAVGLFVALQAKADPFLGIIQSLDGGCFHNLTFTDAGLAGPTSEFVLGEQTKISLQCDVSTYVCSPAVSQSCDAGVGMLISPGEIFPVRTGFAVVVQGARSVSADGGWSCLGRFNALADGGCVAAPAKSALVSICPVVPATEGCKVWLGQGE